MSVQRAITASMAAHAIGTIAGLLSVRYFAKAFSTEEFGFWSAVLGVTSYLSLLNFGVAQAVGSRVATTTGDDAGAAIGAVVRAGFISRVKTTLTALPIAVIASWHLPWAMIFGTHSLTDSTLRWTAMLVLATFLVELPFSVFRAALVGLGAVATERFASTGVVVLRLVAAWCAAKYSISLPTLVLWLFACNIAGHLFVLARLMQEVPGLLAGPFGRRVDEGLRTAGLNFVLLQIAGALVWSSDPLLAGALLDVGSSGKISVTWRVIALAQTVGQLVGPAAAPSLVREWAGGARAEARARSTELGQLALAAIVLVGLALATAGSALVQLWVGRELYIGTAAWLAYCAVLFVQGLLVIPDAFVLQSGQHARYARWTIVEAVVKVCSTLILVRYVGVAAFPLGILVGRLIGGGWAVTHTFASSMDITSFLWVRTLVRPLLVPAVCFGAVVSMDAAWGGSPTPVRRVTAACIASAVFAATFWVRLPARLRLRVQAIFPWRS